MKGQGVSGFGHHLWHLFLWESHHHLLGNNIKSHVQTNNLGVVILRVPKSSLFRYIPQAAVNEALEHSLIYLCFANFSISYKMLLYKLDLGESKQACKFERNFLCIMYISCLNENIHIMFNKSSFFSFSHISLLI